MLNNNMNKELECAVCSKNLEEVKTLLSAGADANLRVNQDNTLLHLASTVEITRELLSCGASVYAKNMYRETPLVYGIKQGIKSDIVRELLNHRADVNAVDRHGNTPLNLAVKSSQITLGVIKELLKYGADINIRNRVKRLTENHYTPLDNSVSLLPYAKLLIKFTLIKNFDKDFTKFINLDPYKNNKNYSILSSYLDDCVCEILKMKTEMIKDNFSLYEIITNKSKRCVCFNTLSSVCFNTLSIRLTEIDISLHYPIYDDIISDKIKPFIERGSLLNKLSELQVWAELDISNQDVKEKKVILDPDSKYNIAEYLSNDDLKNFMIAFCDSNKQANQPSDHANNLVELSNQPDKKLSLYETSTSHCTKRARLE